MTRRQSVLALAAVLEQALERRPANRNIRWALGSNLWNSYPGTQFTDILDLMRDTGFIGLRLTQYPKILEKYGITESRLEREMSNRGLKMVTISFNGATDDPAQHAEVVARARQAMQFLKRFGADRLVVFSPHRGPGPEAFTNMCRGFDRIGEAAREMGFEAGLHNHLGQMVQNPDEIDRCMRMTDPALFYFSPDTAHVYLAGGDPAAILDKYKSRLMMADYKDAKRAALSIEHYLTNTYDLGAGEIDFPACHRVLKNMSFSGWLCVDLDIARQGPLDSYKRCDVYITRTLEPIYA
ncbi:MAG: TIM barrel protein [Acidobacteriia bacterium]|nr:TIM barrel protein [Terriglobia bacterium]